MKDTKAYKMKVIQTNRKVKIYPKVRINNKKSVMREYYQTAQIRLEGNYLMDAGFSPNSQISVQVSDNRILITKI